MTKPHYPKIAQLKTVDVFRQRLSQLGCDLRVDDEILSAAAGSPMAAPLDVGGFRVGNRWCIHPMEGWDAQNDGSPSAHTLRRWRHFGQSGAKLIWGGEAAAVERDGRANPNQTLAMKENRQGLAALLGELKRAHLEKFGTTDDLLVGLQLTHSGRFSRPNSKRLEPRIAYHHPLLDRKFDIDPQDPAIVLNDADLERLIDRYVAAAGVAAELGFQFVDIKACHGYLMHELLSGFDRPGSYGGDYQGRTRVLKTIVRRVLERYPGLMVGVRLSVFDTLPYEKGNGVGRPMPYENLLPYRFGFGLNVDDPLEMDLDEAIRLGRELHELGVSVLNVSCGSPYYNPHIQRPAIFPPSDGYQPPEDPLVGVCRQIHATRRMKESLDGLPVVGSGYSYLQDYLPQVAQAVVRDGWTDFVGLGRMVLSYPEMPDDTLAGRTMARKRICRTFSDCTTAPRGGLVSGCYPLDDYYKALPEAQTLRALKKPSNP